MLYLLPKGKIKLFLSLSPPCNIVLLFELPIKNNKYPNSEWRRGGPGVWILLFSVVTTILSLIAGI